MDEKKQHPNGAGIILKMNADIVLLVKGKESKKWGFPKGELKEIDNGNLLKCAERETLEETGLEIKIPFKSRVGIMFSKKQQQQQKTPKRCYFQTNLQALDKYSLAKAHKLFTNDSMEISRVAWVHRSEWCQFTRSETNTDLWQWIHPEISDRKYLNTYARAPPPLPLKHRHHHVNSSSSKRKYFHHHKPSSSSQQSRSASSWRKKIK